jgi:hypothetical protein
LIQSFSKKDYYYDKGKETEIPANILPKHIVYLARTENFNGDNALDSQDPVYLYISTKTGEQLDADHSKRLLCHFLDFIERQEK